MDCGKNNPFLGEDAKFIFGCPSLLSSCIYIVFFDVAHVQPSPFAAAKSLPRIAFTPCNMMHMQRHRAHHAFVQRVSSMDEIVM